MAKPIVAIVGRPNVGKSSFFNSITGSRISIVDNNPGITRDRIYAEAEWRSRKFILIDTGGIEPNSEDFIMQQMKKQAEVAIDTADVIVFMVDMKEGLTSIDKEVANILRKAKKHVVLAVNKADKVGEIPHDAYEFYNLGMGEIFAISSAHGLGIGDLLDEIFKYFPDEEDDISNDDNIKVAVVGKPNAGKSSLINRIIGEERVIVSSTPGTTRDAIDTPVLHNGVKFTFIDTAGIRKRSKIIEDIEKYSIVRAWTAIERADVCLIMIDAEDGVTEQDTKIAGYAHEQGKASIIVINKWDIVEKETGTLENYKKTVAEKLSFMSYAPSLFISAKTGQRVDKIYEMIELVAKNSAIRISTGMLNDVLNEAIAMVQPPSDKGRRLKIYYITQASVKPPLFIIFINSEKLFHYSYERYIENQLRKNFGFIGTPIKFVHREREKNK